MDEYGNFTTFTQEPKGKNRLTLAVNDSVGYLIYNSTDIVSLNLPSKESSDILICFVMATHVSNSISYDDFMVWKIKR